MLSTTLIFVVSSLYIAPPLHLVFCSYCVSLSGPPYIKLDTSHSSRSHFPAWSDAVADPKTKAQQPLTAVLDSARSALCRPLCT
jgi:hypothetical protein